MNAKERTQGDEDKHTASIYRINSHMGPNMQVENSTFQVRDGEEGLHLARH